MIVIANIIKQTLVFIRENFLQIIIACLLCTCLHILCEMFSINNNNDNGRLEQLQQELRNAGSAQQSITTRIDVVGNRLDRVDEVQRNIETGSLRIKERITRIEENLRESENLIRECQQIHDRILKGAEAKAADTCNAT
ncbi:MAG: hypothetical protein IKK97_01945 [Phascolarctobacterium sp.]|nr:hypothetical protein [Phascolarctobacterium sp.]